MLRKGGSYREYSDLKYLSNNPDSTLQPYCLDKLLAHVCPEHCDNDIERAASILRQTEPLRAAQFFRLTDNHVCLDIVKRYIDWRESNGLARLLSQSPFSAMERGERIEGCRDCRVLTMQLLNEEITLPVACWIYGGPFELPPMLDACAAVQGFVDYIDERFWVVGKSKNATQGYSRAQFKNLFIDWCKKPIDSKSKYFLLLMYFLKKRFFGDDTKKVTLRAK